MARPVAPGPMRARPNTAGKMKERKGGRMVWTGAGEEESASVGGAEGEDDIASRRGHDLIAAGSAARDTVPRRLRIPYSVDAPGLVV